MSRRSREKRETLRGACEPVDNDGIERAFAELDGAQRQVGVNNEDATLNAELPECGQVLARLGDDAARLRDDHQYVEIAESMEAASRLLAASREQVSALQDEIDRLNAIIHTPHCDDFIQGVAIEAEFQRQKHGDEDARKDPAQWYWVVGYLAGKALYSWLRGDTEKAKHHVITTAALCANWHRKLKGEGNYNVHHAPAANEAHALIGDAAVIVHGGG